MFKDIFFILCLVSPMVLSYKSTGPALLVGEKPIWDSRGNGSVCYVDLFGKAAYRYDFGTDEVYQLIIDNEHNIGFLAPVGNAPNEYIVGLGNIATVINWDGQSSSATRVRDLFTVAPNIGLTALSVSPENDLYVGNYASTYCGEPQNLPVYEFLRDGQFAEDGSGFMTTVGLSLINNTVYQVDACTVSLSAFDRDPSNGRLSNQRVVIEFDLPPGILVTGLAADTQGYLYTSAFGDSHVLKIDPSNATIVQRIPVPTPYASGLTFGGPNNDILFVTTAALPVDFSIGTAGPPLPLPAGYLFQIPMDVQGIPTILPTV